MIEYILGIDIGGTNIKSGLFSLKEERIIKKKILKTPKRLEQFLLNLNEIVNYFRKDFNFNKVGVGFPGNVSPNGEILFCPHIPDSIGFNIMNYFRSKLKLSLKIENDANLAALAHLKFINQNISDLICLTIGTGIGGGVILNKNLLNSSRKIGFELGHIQIVEDGCLCSCGKKGCVEAYSSSSGMLNRYGDKNLKEFLDLYKLHRMSNIKATNIIEEGFFYLGVAVGNLINIFAPEVVYVAGGVSKVFDEFYLNFIEGVKKSGLKFLIDKVKFKKSNLEDSGILGAVALWI